MQAWRFPFACMFGHARKNAFLIWLLTIMLSSCILFWIRLIPATLDGSLMALGMTDYIRMVCWLFVQLLKVYNSSSI